MIRDLLIYLLSSDGVLKAGVTFIVCCAIVFTLLYYWRSP